MGRGADLQVSNFHETDIRLEVTASHCMYDGGAEGSNLSVFNGVRVPSGEAFPAAPQYVEAKASSSGGDTCASDRSTFTLTVHAYDESGEPVRKLSTISVAEQDGAYYGSSDTRSATLQIQNGGDRSSVGITVGS